MLTRSTVSLKPADVRKDWCVINADGLVLGRLASFIAERLRGKHKPQFTTHVDCGDHVVVVNAEKVRVTGNKAEQSIYYWHTGYPGGIKGRSIRERLESRSPERVIEKAVERMITRGPLGRMQMRNLHVYAGPLHPHGGNQPKELDVGGMNGKNLVGGPQRDMPRKTSRSNWREEEARGVDVDDLLLTLDNPDRARRVKALHCLAEMMVHPSSRDGQTPVGQVNLRPVPNRLMQALIENVDDPVAGPATALALAYFLYPERWCGISPRNADLARVASDLTEAFRDRDVQFLTTVEIKRKSPTLVRVAARLRDSLGFDLAGRRVVFSPPEWIRSAKTMEIDAQGARVEKSLQLPPTKGTFALCEATLSSENGPRRPITLFVKRDGFVVDHLDYEASELFGPVSSNTHTISASSIASPVTTGA